MFQNKSVFIKNKVRLCGVLKKKGEKGLVKGWKTRWFCQKGQELHYFIDRKEEKLKGTINLSKIESVNTVEGKNVIELITTTRTYFLKTTLDDKKELERWKEGLLACKENFSSKLREGREEGSAEGSAIHSQTRTQAIRFNSNQTIQNSPGEEKHLADILEKNTLSPRAVESFFEEESVRILHPHFSRTLSFFLISFFRLLI